MAEQPDALAYNSVIDRGENFIFFESGFDKLSLREVDLYLGVEKERMLYVHSDLIIRHPVKHMGIRLSILLARKCMKII